MPIYEYQCIHCGERQSFLVRRMAQPFSPKCRFCGSGDLQRLMSTFAFRRSWESLSGDVTSTGRYSDPRQIGRRTEQRFREMGQEVPAEVREMVDRARDGELPDGINDL